MNKRNKVILWFSIFEWIRLLPKIKMPLYPFAVSNFHAIDASFHFLRVQRQYNLFQRPNQLGIQLSKHNFFSASAGKPDTGHNKIMHIRLNCTQNMRLLSANSVTSGQYPLAASETEMHILHRFRIIIKWMRNAYQTQKKRTARDREKNCRCNTIDYKSYAIFRNVYI